MKFLRRRVASMSPGTNLDAATSRKLIESLSCTVCFEFMSHPCVLTCGHTTCAPCWDEWKERHSTCPTCRGESVELKPQSEILRLVAQNLSSVQPCGESVLMKNQRQHESACVACVPKPHIANRLLRTRRAWENRQIRNMRIRRSMEWQRGSASSTREFGAMRVGNAIASSRAVDAPVPDFVMRWEALHRNEFGRIEVPLRVRSWLDGAEMRFIFSV